MSRLVLPLVLLVVLLASVAWYASPTSTAVPRRGAETTPGAAHVPAELVGEDVPSDTARESAEDRRAEVEPSAEELRREGLLPDILVQRGELRVRARDAITGKSLTGHALRVAPEGSWLVKYAKEPVASALLDVGEWSVEVHCARYDPVLLEGVTIVAGEVTAPPEVAMDRGTGSLEVVVYAPLASVTLPPRLELHGAGRSPCPVCPEAGFCETCGFSLDRSVRVAALGESQLLENLAAGEYHLEVYDREDRVLFTREVLLGAREVKRIELDLAFVDLAFHVIGEDDAPFEGVWSEDGELFAGDLQFFFLEAEACCGLARWHPSEEVRRTAVALSGREEGLRLPPAVRWPAAQTAPPKVKSAPLSLDRTAPGRFTIGQVPAISTGLFVSCGPFFTTVPLDLATWADDPIEVRLDARCNTPSAGLQKMVSCTDCHSLPTWLPR
ncbi:MAG: hypothetical protein O2816_08885 [Planctomycetota bacterium]|nr:hypothetical protein [Planctomycetota bacterium]